MYLYTYIYFFVIAHYCSIILYCASRRPFIIVHTLHLGATLLKIETPSLILLLHHNVKTDDDDFVNDEYKDRYTRMKYI